MKSIIQLTFLVLFFSACATTVPITIPRYPKKNGAQIRSLLQGQRNVAVIVSKSKKNLFDVFKGYDRNWDDTVEAVTSKALTDFGYYNLVDTRTRKERLQSIAYSQSGLTQEALEIGRELQAHALFIVRLTSQPKAQCRIEDIKEEIHINTLPIHKKKKYNERSYKYPYKPSYKNSQQNTTTGIVTVKRPTGVLYVTMYLEGRLTHLETGRAITHFYNETLRMPSVVGDRTCISPDNAFNKILQQAGYALARELSPRMTKFSIPLMESSPDLKGVDRKETNFHLKDGVKWAKSGSMKEAKDAWDRALTASKNQSGASIWNLGVYYWHLGNFNKAEKYFGRFKKERLRLLDNNKRRILTIFKEDKAEASLSKSKGY